MQFMTDETTPLNEKEAASSRSPSVGDAQEARVPTTIDEETVEEKKKKKEGEKV